MEIKMVKPTLWQAIRQFGFSCDLKCPFPVVQIGFVVVVWDGDDWRKTIHVSWAWDD